MQIKIAKVRPQAKIPTKATPGSGAYDIYAALDDPMQIDPMQRVAVPTGLVMEIPAGYIFSIRPRSGLSIRHGLTLTNAPGTIDSDFRGEVKILMVNLGKESFTIENGDRIAQGLLEKTENIDFLEVEQSSLSKTERGSGGFGSTGI
ncbi:MAG: dUTP diphosphatase [Candidatus Hydrogenedentota bacterium]|nr:MAG: dUTP diphosphatase [Candidatus Hydrogenedentota bacterium]